MLLSKIDPIAFALSLAAGLVIVCSFAPRPTVVIKFPYPDHPGVLKRVDNSCYTYEVSKVDCDSSTHGSIHPVPARPELPKSK